MAASPLVMLLDESFAGVAPLTVASLAEVLGQLRRMEIGILVSDQNVEAMLTIIDRAYVLHECRIAFSGSPSAMLTDEEVRRSYLGKDHRLAHASAEARPNIETSSFAQPGV